MNKERNKQSSIGGATLELSDELLDEVAGGAEMPEFKIPTTPQAKERRKYIWEKDYTPTSPTDIPDASQNG